VVYCVNKQCIASIFVFGLSTITFASPYGAVWTEDHHLHDYLDPVSKEKRDMFIDEQRNKIYQR